MNGIDGAPVSTDDKAVVIRLGEVELGIPISLVREVVRVPPITRVPFPPPSVIGVVSVRNTVLATIDLGDRLFGVPADRNGRLLVVVAGEREEQLALLVDAVVGLVEMESRVEEPPEEIVDSLPEGWVEGVLAPDDDRLIALLDVEAVLAPKQTLENRS